MRKTGTVLALLLVLCVLLSAAWAETYPELNGTRPDETVYQGDWRDIYLRVLEEHSYKIHAYQERTIEMDGEFGRELSCFPVGLRDLNGAGVPELYFLEADGDRGDLWIYSANGETGQCVLYVPGITRLDDEDEMQGFQIRLTGGNLLTIRHCRYEEEYLLQFYVNREGPYDLMDWLYHLPDGSGEGEDRFYRNGQEISADAYYDTDAQWFEGEGTVISDYFAEDEMSYGFDYPYETAVKILGSSVAQRSAPQAIYGLAVQKLATRKGPGTQYDGGGSYNVKGQQIKLLARAWDGSIWWIKCEIPYHGEIRVLWTGYKRFDKDSFNLEDLPEEEW